MKQKLITAAVIVFLSSFIVPLKQTDIKSAYPYFGYSFTTGGSTGTPEINLDKSSAVYQTQKGKTVTLVLNIDGVKSAVRLKTGSPEFHAYPDPGVSASAAAEIYLYKLNVDRKNRSLSLEATGIISATKVVITVSQTDERTLRIITNGTGGILSPGEYAFVEKNMAAANSTLTVWCFGID